jgi:hypothetical protein
LHGLVDLENSSFVATKELTCRDRKEVVKVNWYTATKIDKIVVTFISKLTAKLRTCNQLFAATTNNKKERERKE